MLAGDYFRNVGQGKILFLNVRFFSLHLKIYHFPCFLFSFKIQVKCDLLCHLQSLVRSVSNTVLKIVVVNCQGLNVDPIGQEENVVFQKKSGKI